MYDLMAFSEQLYYLVSMLGALQWIISFTPYNLQWDKWYNTTCFTGEEIEA